MKIILMGPQGSGKGTQAKKLAADLKIPHISTGDLFRDNVKNNTELGKKIKNILDRGDLVPDDIVIQLANERLKKDDCINGFIADGFPRNLNQVIEIRDIWRVDWVFNLWIDTQTSMERIAHRLTCPKCNTPYSHEDSKKSKGKCMNCHVDLVSRSDDDKVEVVMKRLVIFWKELPQIIEYYRAAEVYRKLDARVSIDALYNNLKNVLEI